MAKVNNLFVKTDSPKKVFISNNKTNLKLNTIKKVYYNNNLIWQNSNPFIFVKDSSQLDFSTLDSDTLVFVGFAPNTIEGTYDIMENEQDKPTQEGQMVVQTTEGDETE